MAELLGESIHTLTRGCAYPYNIISERQVHLFESVRYFAARVEIHFVDHDHGRDTTRLSYDEKPVDQIPAGLRLGSRHHNEQTVGVGNEDPDGPSTEAAAGNRGLPRKHFFDDVRTLVGHLDPNSVADHHLVARSFLELEPTSQRRLDDLIRLEGHRVDTAPGAADHTVHEALLPGKGQSKSGHGQPTKKKPRPP